MKRTPLRDGLKELKAGRMQEVRVFTTEQVERVFANFGAIELRSSTKARKFITCCVYLAAFCGLRFGEVMGLASTDLDLERRVVRVRHCMSAHDGLKAPKTKAGIRDIPIPEFLVAILRDWVAGHYLQNDRKLIFLTDKGRTIGSSYFHEYLWQPLLSAADLREPDELGRTFHYHALRHFCVSWWIENGVPITEVSKLIGHSKIEMTLAVYAHSVRGRHLNHEVFDAIASRLVVPSFLPSPSLAETGIRHEAPNH